MILDSAFLQLPKSFQRGLTNEWLTNLSNLSELLPRWLKMTAPHFCAPSVSLISQTEDKNSDMSKDILGREQ